MSPRARQSKGKARFNAYNDLVAEAEAAERRADKLEISIPPGPRLGDRVVDADGLVKGYGDRLLIDGLSFLLPPGGIVGVIGPNGAGKTTLFRMIVGEDTPDQGELEVGATVALAYVDQSRDSLAAEPASSTRSPAGSTGSWSGTASCTGEPTWPASASRAATSRRRSGSSPAASATGSSWPRSSRAAATCSCSTSRPTISTSTRCVPWRRRLLGFPGCAVVISHDRWFLDRIATHVLAFEGDSEVRWCEGNFSDYEADRKKRLGVEADQPHRLRYKPLVRD